MKSSWPLQNRCTPPCPSSFLLAFLKTGFIIMMLTRAESSPSQKSTRWGPTSIFLMYFTHNLILYGVCTFLHPIGHQYDRVWLMWLVSGWRGDGAYSSTYLSIWACVWDAYSSGGFGTNAVNQDSPCCAVVSFMGEDRIMVHDLDLVPGSSSNVVGK